MTRPFRILCLSGGGARGIFQARLLEMLEQHHAGRLFNTFDLIAATSTGAFVGLAVAAGIPTSTIVRMYREHAADVFRPRLASRMRRGGRYNQSTLRNLLQTQFASRRMNDLKTRALITASVVDTFEGRFFTENDQTVTLVEAALATSAAPTYFPPLVPQEHDRGYMDGGLWANDPSYLAFHYAVTSLGIPTESIRLFSVGTGRVPYGTTPETIRNLRLVSFRTLRFLRDFTSNLQDWFSQRLCEETLSPTQFLRINPYLKTWISLDDAHSALSFLPALAESEYERHSTTIAYMIATEHLTTEKSQPTKAALPRPFGESLGDTSTTFVAPATRILPDQYNTYYGDYYLYNWAVIDSSAISEKKLTISPHPTGCPNADLYIHEHVILTYRGRMRVDRRSLYFDLLGEGHAEEVRLVYHEPIDGKITVLIGVFAATTLDSDPFCGKIVVSKLRLSHVVAQEYLGTRKLIIVDSKHQRHITEQPVNPGAFINRNIT
jgi:predicted acylesterase/phospholipase RssA